MIKDWELRVWSPTGAGPRIIPRDASHIPRSGLRMQVTPEGDCREASFTAKGSGLAVAPLDCVQVVYDGVPLFYGEVRVGGNVRDVDGHSVTLRSLALRLGEVTLSEAFATPQQPAHLTVRALIQDVLGALGGTVEYDPALCPDLGFDLAPVVASNYQTPRALLEKIAEAGAGLGVSVRFGVRADRRFYCVPASTDTLALTADMLAGLTWREPVAEAPCTAVLWYVARRADGTWLTHLSQSAEAAMYGLRVKRLSWQGSEAPLWQIVEADYAADPLSTVNWTFEASPGHLSDGLGVQGQRHRIEVIRSDASAAPEPLTLTATPNDQGAVDRVVVAGRADHWTHENITVGDANYLRRESTPVTADIVLGPGPQNVTLSWNLTPYQGTGAATSAMIAVPVTERPAGSYTELALVEFRLERVDRALLDRLAAYHYRTPAREPADIELRQFIAPANLPKYVTLGDYQSIVDAWEYRLTAARGLTLACLAGQAEDPAALAQADLIKARDGQAVITAITAGGV
ncbi:hypothetical protein ACFP81_06360 [Deinococcus lacus]|uniref:Uncharacterized protein n=1 Tax=Deinococcus lacus TaxID=392561 RepID=A0ABW1YE19_9DEIO